MAGEEEEEEEEGMAPTKGEAAAEWCGDGVGGRELRAAAAEALLLGWVGGLLVGGWKEGDGCVRR